jgi:hypothetical protein
MLGYMVDDLTFKGQLNSAKGILERNNLSDYVQKETLTKLADVVYDESKDEIPIDDFAPSSKPTENYI